MTDRHITDQLLAAASDPRAEEELLRSVYDELRRMAHHYLGGERQQETLQTTALVHEAYLKLVGQDEVTARGRAYFFAAAARAMRQVLVDAARRRRRDKRGGGDRPASLDGIDPGDARSGEEVLWVHQALERLAKEYPRQAKVVECRFFGGLSIEETAQVLEVSVRTVKRDWSFAQAWFHREWSA